MTDRFTAKYLGARATPGLVNRKPILKKIKAAIDDQPKSHVIYLTAPGGIGKTFLLRDILRRYQEGGEWRTPESKIIAAGDLVDLYHTHTHSIEGLTRDIAKVLGPQQTKMKTYNEALARFEREKHDVGGRETSTLRDEVARTFLADLNKLTKNHRLVLALDTAEKLLYESDRFQEVLGLSEASNIAVLPWLLEKLLPQLNNAVILIAGRPRPERLRTDLRKALPEPECLIEHEMPGFEKKEDVFEYFATVAEALQREGHSEIAERIESIPEDTREVIWRYTGGRPILLSLMIDYLVVANELLPVVKAPVEEARDKSADELREIEQNIEVELVRLFQDTGQPVDEAIRTLAWARKGLDAEMLATVADMEVEEAAQILNELRALSFVKVRPDDDRVFLHDEMYDMFHRHVLARLPKARHKRMYSAIVNYYQTALIPQVRGKLGLLESSLREEISKSGRVTTKTRTDAPFDMITALARGRQELEDAIVEEVYYLLRQDPLNGFQSYSEYATEAILAVDVNRDMLLRDELLTFLNAPEHKGASQIGGLERSVAGWEAVIQWVMRFVLYRGDYEGALELTHQIRTHLGDLMQEVGPVAEADLNLWEGWALSYLGRDLKTGLDLLNQAIQTLEQAFQIEDSLPRWYRPATLAMAYNNLGYLYRTRGQFQQAIEAYQRALPLWRDTKLEAEHATTLNNLAWAYGEAEDFSQAVRLARNGLELRQRLGPRSPVGLSLNTLGLILMRNDQPEPARVACERALAIFHELGQTRGEGMACTALAEALRRMNSTLPELYFPEERADMLRQAEQYAKRAVDIFSIQRRQELPRRVEALIVYGSVLRDWADLRLQYKSEDDPDQGALADGAIAALRRTSDEASGDLLYRKVEALVNLAWIYVYTGQPSQARSVLKDEVWPAIPHDYFITEAGLPRSGLRVPFLWIQLAKSHTLRGHLALQDFRSANAEFKKTREDEQQEIAHQHLRTAAREYTLGMAYDSHYWRDIRTVGRGHDRIYNDLKILNLQELKIVLEETNWTARQYQLGEQTLMRIFLEQSFGLRETRWESII